MDRGYIMLRASGDPDAFPATDLGLRRMMERLGCEPGRPGRWRPWRAYAALHLWAALADAGRPAPRPPGGHAGGRTQDVMPSKDLATTGHE